MALLPPSFLSSSPTTVRSARTGAVKEASAGLVRPAAQRGHGPARLDGTRARATVAVKVMKSGETAGQGNGHPRRRPHGKRSAQARSWKPGRRRQPSGARERWKPEGARRRRRLDALRTTARPASFLGRGRPYSATRFDKDGDVCDEFMRISWSGHTDRCIDRCCIQNPPHHHLFGGSRIVRSELERLDDALLRLSTNRPTTPVLEVDLPGAWRGLASSETASRPVARRLGTSRRPFSRLMIL